MGGAPRSQSRAGAKQPPGDVTEMPGHATSLCQPIVLYPVLILIKLFLYLSQSPMYSAIQGKTIFNGNHRAAFKMASEYSY